MISNPDILIADDDSLALQRTLDQVKDFLPEARVIAASCAIDVLKHLVNTTFDVLILDVRMPGLSGFDLLQQANLSKDVKVIFQTEYSEYALQAYDFNPVHFLLKPVSNEKLNLALCRALENTAHKLSSSSIKNQEADRYLSHIVARKSSFSYRIECADIVYAIADVGFCVVYTKENKEHICDLSVSWLASQLNPQSFLKINRSTIVNLNFVEGVHGRTLKSSMKVKLYFNKELEVSRKMEVLMREKFLATKTNFASEIQENLQTN